MYAGNETRSAYDNALEDMRARHGVNMEVLDYEKNFLSSRVRTAVRGDTGALSQAKDLPEPLKSLAEEFVLIHDIEHGPLVLSDGAKVLASRVTTTLDMDSLEPAFAAAWHEACSCEQPLTLVSEMGLGGESEHALSLLKMAGQVEEAQWRFDGVEAQIGVAADKRVTTTGTTGELSFNNGARHATLSAGEWQSQTREHWGVALEGDFSYKAPSLAIGDDEKQVSLKDIALGARSLVEGETLRSDVEITVADFDAPDLKLQNSRLALDSYGIPAKVAAEFTEKASVLDLSADGELLEFLELYSALLAPGAGLKYSVQTALEDAGEVNSHLELNFEPPAGQGLEQLHTVGDLLQSLRGEAALDFDAALLAQLEVPPEQAAMALSTFTQNGDQYSFGATLEGGQLMLNGQPFPLEMFFAEVLAQPLPTKEQIAEMAQAAQ